ncbi:MAG: HDOD domain-containing protein [gamma proteobacterium endosymbiont of Lamellibrachia anaximandri]|nr:HDOD domain-containing protein [gamma proteobacterium endosymbiont of Lamellibrachia anaximandri]MBL3532694.1 HDOD domain-containing protein [gamma proteobacterium endosymbiont of Lamellibrachia anaximandri]MBL3601514.1 HDOD domain-containing protein [gamma proteobacterium endosymbiont of Lamellibrachia anaximandri]
MHQQVFKDQAVNFNIICCQHAQAIEQAKAHQGSLHQAERTLLGVDYAQVSAALMRHWKLPQSLWGPVEFQLGLEKARQYQFSASLVQIAAMMTEATDRGEQLDNALIRVSPLAWQVTGLSTDRCLEASQKVDAEVSGVMQLIFPAQKTTSGQVRSSLS